MISESDHKYCENSIFVLQCSSLLSSHFHLTKLGYNQGKAWKCACCSFYCLHQAQNIFSFLGMLFYNFSDRNLVKFLFYLAAPLTEVA